MWPADICWYTTWSQSHAKAVFMRGGNPNPTQTNRGNRAGIYTLLQNAYWVLEPRSPKKPAAVIFIIPNGAVAHPTDASKRE